MSDDISTKTFRQVKNWFFKEFMRISITQRTIKALISGIQKFPLFFNQFQNMREKLLSFEFL